jgi:hypothetical protein
MMSKTLVSRRTALKALGTTAGAVTFLPWLSEEGLASYAAVQKAKAAPALKALTAAQYATTEALAEAIIPADERSPGAKEARVADYIDLLLSESKPPLRKEWIDGLTAFDAEAAKRFGVPFVKLTPAQVETFLTDVSAYERAKPAGPPDQASAISRNEQPDEKPILVEGLMGEVSRFDPNRKRPPLDAFFAVTKRATIHGYYTSEIGIHKELRYKGNQVLAEFVGCQTQDGKDCPHCGQKAGN